MVRGAVKISAAAEKQDETKSNLEQALEVRAAQPAELEMAECACTCEVVTSGPGQSAATRPTHPAWMHAVRN